MKTKIIMVSIVCVVLVGGYFLITMGAGDFTEDWGIKDEFSLQGEWRITPYAVLESGERVNMIEYNPPLRWVKHDGDYIFNVEYVLEAKATRDTTLGSFDSVKIDFSNTEFGMRRPSLSQHQIGNKSWFKTGWGTKTLTFPANSLDTGWHQVLTIGIPQDFDKSRFYLPKATVPITYEEKIASLTRPDLPTLFANWEPDDYQEGTPINIQYYSAGIITVQGLNAATGDGKVVEVTRPGMVSTTFTLGEHTVQLDWRTSVTYS